MKQFISNLFSRVAAVAAVALLTAATAWAETSTVTASKIASSSSSWTGSKGETWSVTVNGGATDQNVINGYAQVGTKNSPSTSISLSTNGISGTITSIVIDCASYNGLATVSATVGGTAFGTQSQSTPSWSNNLGGNVTFTGSASGAIVLTMTNGSNGRAMYIKSITVTYEASTLPACAKPTFSPAAGAYSSSQDVTISTTTAGATIYYTTNGNDPTTNSSVYSSAISVSENTTIKAIAVKSDYDNSEVATATYTIINFDHAGTSADPYSVADAHTAIDANIGLEGVYATGIVSQIVTDYSSQFGNVSFDFVDESGDEVSLRAYRCEGEDAANVTVGDVVVVKGNLTKYNSTYEFAQGCELVSLTHPTVPSITVDPTSINATSAGKNGTISVTYNNITDVAADVAFFAADGTTAATYNWIVAEVNSDNNVEYIVEANTSSEPRTAYLKVWAYDDDMQEVYSDLITVSQERFVADYATLPFEFDGGKASIANTAGLSQDGLGDDYGSSPKLKFDGTGDWLMLQLNESPGILSFDIKGNSFSGGIFKVQTSTNGETFTDVKTYTEVSGTTSTEKISNLAPEVRYIKWIYTNKSSGNVALGNISLAEYVDLYAVNWTAGENTELFVFAGDESESIENGEKVAEGTTVMVSVDVDPGYHFGSLVVKDANNNELELTEIEPNVYYSFEMPASDVTITSTAEEDAPPTGSKYTLFTGDLVEGDYIIYYDGYAMNNVESGDRLQYVEVTPATNTITTDNAAIVWHIAKSGNYWTIYSADANAYAAGTGAKNKAQMLADGTDDKALWSVSGTETYEFVNKKNAANSVNSNLRKNGTYGFACYSTETGGALSLYKLVEPAAPDTYTLTLTAGDGGYWGTFYNGGAMYVLPEGAQAFTMNADKKLFRLGGSNDKGRYIPAGTAVVIISDVSAVTLTKGNYAEEITVNGDENILQGDDFPVEVDGNQYVLGKKNGVVGFYKFLGADIPANKAFYVISE